MAKTRKKTAKTPSRKTTPRKRRAGIVQRAAAAGRKWSRAVTERSNALDLEKSVFTRTPKQIAQSLKRSAERSRRRKGSPFQSAMSMLTFYANRAGRNLPATRKRAIQQAKDALRKLYGR